MGLYINQNSKGETLPAVFKATCLIEDGAKMLFSEPDKWEEGIVCVVNNGYFDAAAYVHSHEELEAFKSRVDPRPKVWLKYSKAKELAK